MMFQPKTEKEILEENLWPAGNYSFEVAKAEEAISEKGNQMIKLTLNIQNDAGRSAVVFDYLVEVMAFKLRHCAYACGLGDKYEEGKVEAIEFEGRTGLLKLAIKRNKAGQYPDKNVVADYITEKLKSESKIETIDDAIPF